MTKMPTIARNGSEQEIGKRIIKIASNPNGADDATQADKDFFKAEMKRARASDSAGINPDIINDATHPAKTLLVAEAELYNNGKTQFVADLESGGYFRTQWILQIIKMMEGNASDAITNGDFSQDCLDRIIKYMTELFDVPNDEVTLTPEDFFEFSIGEYVCKQCY